jgi:Carboxypeptidase regulatory-like domain
MRGALRLFAVIITSAALYGAEVHVSIDDRSADARCLKERAVVVATPASAAGGEVQRFAVPPGQNAPALTLPESDAWELRVAADGCWSSTETWATADGPNLTIQTFAAATLHGTFVRTSSGSPSRLRASAFRLTAGARPVDVEPEPLDCSVDYPEWRCVVPAQLPIDVRLEPEGFAPLYAWNVTAKPGETREAEPYTLMRGSSLAGWVEDADGKPLRDAAVRLAVLQPEHPDASRTSPLQYVARTNARGFFQFSGVAPGDYRLSSRAAGYAPLVVPALTIRPADALTWPHALAHQRPVELTVTVDPPRNRDGSPWTVRLKERMSLVPGEPAAATVMSSSPDRGIWAATGLRPDRYELTVSDSTGAVVETREVDLTAGAGTLAVSLDPLEIAGTVKVGDEPLPAADVRFASSTGKAVFTSTDEDGRFEVRFPSPGRWTPTVYPKGRGRGAHIRVEPVEIAAGSSPTLDIALPGGRLRGRVTQDRVPVKAAIHLVRTGSLAAQELTGQDGAFDLLGLEEGKYSLSAEGETGATSRPVEIRLVDGETADVEVAIEPYRVIRATVRTPGGRPASGAIARLSIDGGLSWSEVVLDVRGQLEYSVPRGVMHADVIVLTYSYPAAMARLDTTTAVTIDLSAQGGRLLVNAGRAFIIRDNLVAPVPAFYLPASLGVTPAAHLEIGSYLVCAEPRAGDTCRRVTVAPGSSAVVDLEKDAK